MTHPLRSDRSRAIGTFKSASLGRRAVLAGTFQALALLAACAGRTPGAAPGPQAALPASPASSPTATIPIPTPGEGRACVVPAVVAPTPIPYPGYTQVEPSTGLHVTGPAQEVDLASYRLAVAGLVDNALSLSYDDVRCLPRIAALVTLTCPGFFSDEANLAGVTFARLIELARPQAEASLVTMTSVEGYSASLTLHEAQVPENFLAYQWEGQPLPRSHGFPVRAVIPVKSGSNWVKWVVRIELS
jgi:DMSO/TMAO reductase YedYZ molybdopterin-dependent catalytic subunit